MWQWPKVEEDGNEVDLGGARLDLVGADKVAEAFGAPRQAPSQQGGQWSCGRGRSWWPWHKSHHMLTRPILFLVSPAPSTAPPPISPHLSPPRLSRLPVPPLSTGDQPPSWSFTFITAPAGDDGEDVDGKRERGAYPWRVHLQAVTVRWRGAPGNSPRCVWLWSTEMFDARFLGMVRGHMRSIISTYISHTRRHAP